MDTITHQTPDDYNANSLRGQGGNLGGNLGGSLSDTTTHQTPDDYREKSFRGRRGQTIFDIPFFYKNWFEHQLKKFVSLNFSWS